MADQSNRTFVCSVLFLDIVEYSKKSVTEQLKLKQRFNALLVAALQHVAVSDRIVLDTGDGAAISFLGNPEDSLFVAIDLRDTIAAESPDEHPPLLVRIGVNLGPVRLIKDINGQLNIIGDGINVAQRVMSFGEPGTILVSRSYYEVVSRLSDDYGQIFQDVGTRTDKHVREHSVYAVGQVSSDFHQFHADTNPGNAEQFSWNAKSGGGKGPSEDTIVPKPRISLRFLFGVPLVAIAIIAAGVVFRYQRDKVEASVSVPASTAKVAEAPPMVSNSAPANSVHGAGSAPISGDVGVSAPERPKPAMAKVSIALSIVPWGEVFVDGRKGGISPPLKALKLVPGKHTIEIRNTAFPAYTEVVTVKSDSRIIIRHRFQ